MLPILVLIEITTNSFLLQVDLEFNLGLLTVFLSPRQLYLLFEIFNSLISPHTQDTRLEVVLCKVINLG